MAYWIWSVRPEHFPAFVRTGTFAVRRQGRKGLAQIRPGDTIYAYLPGSRVLAGAFEATGAAFEDPTALVPGGHYPHRLRVRPLTVLSEEAWIPYDAFADKLAALDEYGEKETPDLRFRAMMQHVVHRLPKVDGLMLDFLVRTRAEADPERLIALTERYKAEREGASTVTEPGVVYPADASGRAEALEALIGWIEAQGFVYEPWEVAAFVTALRTKPFVVLAGITGVGKTRLPLLVAEGTGGVATVVPVRPDWTDPAEVLGYTDLAGTFRPGALLAAAHAASQDARHQHLLVLDEMNLARPEHYLAEVLSGIERRAPDGQGGWSSPPLLGPSPGVETGAWSTVRMPASLGLVGTVNIDESAHVFSRKVLDRAFVLELGATGLGVWQRPRAEERAPAVWPSAYGQPRALRLSQLEGLLPEEVAEVERVVTALTEVDQLLAPAGFGVGYRSRDEATLFVHHAGAVRGSFRTRDGAPVEPFDLALLMKVLPRLEGRRPGLSAALDGLLGWAWTGAPAREDEARSRVETWAEAGRPATLAEARFPRTAARVARMLERLMDDGYTSFWD